jgi:4-amino-4-deoxy-L-arabinose transferase-like glycosyltransferase
MALTGVSTRRSWHAWLLLGLLALALLGCNRGLWTPDEPREAEIGREMALSPGLIPTLDGRRFIEKPPLYYWTLAGAYDITGGPSVLAARAVSVVAALATLALLYAWAVEATGLAAAALTCAFMLATSVQFLISTHWVLLDPLLMLTTTLAAWAAWRLLAILAPRPGQILRLQCLLYGALTLALWIKGPVGPALIGAGLAAHGLAERPVHWRRLRPLLGCVWLALMLAVLALAIDLTGGRAALWEWAYVNHVQRLLHPGATGHRQPLLYYSWTLAYAVLPWLPALLQALRPAHWRRRVLPVTAVASGTPAAAALLPDAARYGAWMSGAMLLLLSLSATKRETYLLPVLPLLFLWVGIRSHEWWNDCAAGRDTDQLGGVALRLLWWSQVLLLAVYALAAPAAAWVWTRRASAPILTGLVIALGVVAALLRHALVRRSPRSAARDTALPALMLATAATAAAVLLAFAGPVLNATKDMAPFMRALGRQLPPGQPVYATHADETLAAEVPFYTGRSLIPLRAHAAVRPPWLLVQNVDHVQDDPAGYRLVMSQSFGSGRSLALWRVRTEAPAR